MRVWKKKRDNEESECNISDPTIGIVEQNKSTDYYV
jgi:hypothetical protein